jgi:carboxylesterase type B
VNATFAAYAAVGDLDLEAIATRALELYPLENIETDFQAMEQFILMDNDAIWRCPSMQLAQTLSAVAETHTYLFAAGPFHTSSLIDFGFPLAPPGASYGWASHGQENHALMNTLCSAKTPRLSQEDLRRCFDAAPDQWRLSRAMGQYWMAISGPPGVLESEDGHGKLEWPALNSSMTFQDIPVVVFDLPQVQSVQTGLHAAQCEYWNQLHLGTL